MLRIIKNLIYMLRGDKIMEDVKIKCKDCGEEFIFTTGEQEYFEKNNLIPPKRCKNCRDARKNIKY